MDNSLLAVRDINHKYIVVEKELTSKKYGLVWEEHEESVDVFMKTKIPVFKEVNDKEIVTSNENLNYNFLLEGDNLHSLILLEKVLKGKVDLIYIDPPYNRGTNDFIYNDNYVAAEDGFKHSKWLSFMSERLRIAKNLLSKDGFIIISIDDNEYAPLKLLCDEIFGDTNYINTFVWKRNSSGKTEKEKYTVNTEYVLLYSKSKNYELGNVYKPLAESSQKMYSKDDNDGRGKYATVSLQKPKDPGPETTYDYVDNTGKVWKCPPKGWRMVQSKIKELENDGRLYFGGKSLRVKDYWNERENPGKRIDTLWNDIAENNVGSKELEKVVGKQSIFNNPKPVDLIKRCLGIGNKDAIVLDFFAGSGTTGQAVLEKNIEDGGQRKFIICTNNEKGICENITYNRLKTVITGKRDDKTVYSDGIVANLKYYKTCFVEKNDDNLYDELLQYTKEMIQLEHGVNVDNNNYIMIMNDEEMDCFEKNFSVDSNIQAVFINQDVLLTTSQERLLEGMSVNIIPNCYFDFELREAGELW